MSRYKEFWYNSWRSMISRCYNKNAKNYKYYGAKGIAVCKEWLIAENFGEWAKENGWFKGATLDRVDNSKGYSPENCRWATKREQARNRSTNHLITYNGETHTVTEWAEMVGVNRTLLLNRLYRGWTGEELFEPRFKNQYDRRKKCGT